MAETKYIVTLEVSDTRDNIKTGNFDPDEDTKDCQATDLRTFLIPMAEYIYSVNNWK